MIELSRNRLMQSMTKQLPTLRARLGISQSELAERAGISRQTLSNIETMTRPMSWITFMALLAFFENNKESLSQLSLIDFFNSEDFSCCLVVQKASRK